MLNLNRIWIMFVRESFGMKNKLIHSKLLGSKTWRVLSGAKPRLIAAIKLELRYSIPHRDNLFHIIDMLPALV